MAAELCLVKRHRRLVLASSKVGRDRSTGATGRQVDHPPKAGPIVACVSSHFQMFAMHFGSTKVVPNRQPSGGPTEMKEGTLRKRVMRVCAQIPAVVRIANASLSSKDKVSVHVRKRGSTNTHYGPTLEGPSTVHLRLASLACPAAYIFSDNT